MPRKRPKSERGPGRPYAGKALYERVHWAEWVEETAEEHRQAGSRKPYVDALLDLLELTEEPEAVCKIIANETQFKRISKNFKKKRIKGRRESQMMKELAERRDDHLRRLRPAEPTASPPTAVGDEWPLTKQDLKAYLSDPAVRRDLATLRQRRR
jgi:hypothetical protein